MKSSTGVHYIALDHIRAVAAFIVFTWHFVHVDNGYLVPMNYVPDIFPFAILDEGHTGVALFMTLSGYLFAKLLDGKRVDFKNFCWNRALRLVPLLAVIVLMVGVVTLYEGRSLLGYAKAICVGWILPTLPNGGWSITVEFHYYMLLPALLWMFSKPGLWPLALILLTTAIRFCIYEGYGEIQRLAYWTIVGRIDQFALGMFAYKFRKNFTRRHSTAFAAFTLFAIFFWYFDQSGGFYLNPSYPSPSPIWIFLPTIEGVAYAILIAWYDNSFAHSISAPSRFVARLGEYSYSIYLLHLFVVEKAAKFINEHIMTIGNFYVACVWSFILFCCMIVPGFLSFRFIELPFLKLRRNYVISSREPAVGCGEERTALVEVHGDIGRGSGALAANDGCRDSARARHRMR